MAASLGLAAAGPWASRSRCPTAADGVTPFDFAEAPVLDGAAHPSDLGPGETTRVAGVLRFVPSGRSGE